MVKIALALVGLAFALSGCLSSGAQAIPDRYFTTYQAMLSNQTWRAIEAGPYKAAPGPVKIAYSDCSAAYVMSAYTEAETSRLDAYARHEITMTIGEIRNLDAQARDRLGGDLTYETLDRLAAVCPAQVPAFKQYFKPL